MLINYKQFLDLNSKMMLIQIIFNFLIKLNTISEFKILIILKSLNNIYFLETKMNYKVFGILLFISIIFSSIQVSNCNQCLSINEPLSQLQLQNISPATYIGQFLNTVLTGNCSGQGETSDALDNNTLDIMLEGALLFFLSVTEANPPENIGSNKFIK